MPLKSYFAGHFSLIRFVRQHLLWFAHLTGKDLRTQAQ